MLDGIPGGSELTEAHCLLDHGLLVGECGLDVMGARGSVRCDGVVGRLCLCGVENRTIRRPGGTMALLNDAKLVG